MTKAKRIFISAASAACVIGLLLWALSAFKAGNDIQNTEFLVPVRSAEIKPDSERAVPEIRANASPDEVWRRRPEYHEPHNGIDSFGLSDHEKRRWQGRLSPSLRELGAVHRQGRGVQSFYFLLFDGEEIAISVRDYLATGDESGVFTGEVAGEPGSLVTMAYVGLAEAGSIHLPSRAQVFEIRSGPNDTVILSEVDVPALGECGLHHEHSANMNVPEPIP